MIDPLCFTMTIAVKGQVYYTTLLCTPNNFPDLILLLAASVSILVYPSCCGKLLVIVTEPYWNDDGSFSCMSCGEPLAYVVHRVCRSDERHKAV